MPSSLLDPSCEKAPTSPDLQYAPPDSVPYKISARDSWWTLAERPEVKAAKLSALDLCVYNFRTRNPAEINWYLRNKVGCTKATVDKKNYKFSEDAAPGIVYLPKAAAGGKAPPIVLDDTVISGKAPSSASASGVEEFTIDKESKAFSLRYVRAKVKIVGKLTVNWGNASSDVRVKASAGLLKREFGVGAEAKIGQDLSVQYSMKLKESDVKNPKAWKKALAEASEVTIKRKFNNILFSAVSTGFRVPSDGLFFVVKFTSNDRVLKSNELSWFMELPPDSPITAKCNLEISFLLGPGEAQLSLLANPGVLALSGLFAWVGFAGYGIAHTMNKADQLAFQSWYVTGYVDAVFPPVGGGGHQLPTKPEDRKRAEEMLRVGKQDAEMTARTDFADGGLPPMQAYRLYILSMLDADDDPYASRQARGLFRDLVNEKVNASKGAG